MDKQTLNTFTESVAYNVIPAPEQDEEFDEYVQRAYPLFEEHIAVTDNPVESEIEGASQNPQRNAASKLAVRRRIVELYCQHRDPVGIEEDEVTVDDILNFNDIDATAEELKSQMGAKGFNNMVKGLQSPKEDKMTETEKRQKRQAHYAGYQPCWPSEKEHDHNSGGTTYKFHWAGDLQQEFVEDHQLFLDEFDLSDSFPENSSE